MKNNGESIVYFSVTLLLLLSLIILSSLLIKKEISYQVAYINKSKCLNDTNATHKNYVNSIIKINRIIQGCQLAKSIPTFKIASANLIRLAKISQEIFYYKYTYDILRSKYCNFPEIKNYLAPIPFAQKNRTFKREIDQTVKIIKKKYVKKICFRNLNLEVKTTFTNITSGGVSKWEAEEKEICF